MQEISKIENLQSQIAQIQSISGDISTALSLIDDEKDNTNELYQELVDLTNDYENQVSAMQLEITLKKNMICMMH